ncbi:phosphatidylglycerophosphatase A [Candidatus Dependentiae bacterium]
MVVLEKIKEYSYNIATIGGLGKWKTGAFIASLLAFPLLIFDRFLYVCSASVFYWFIFLLVAASCLIIYFASNFVDHGYVDNIVWDKVIGLMLTFAYIPLKFRLMLFGFIIFHLINFLRPFILRKCLVQKINELPLGIEIISGDIISGFICNFFLQLIFWIMA